MPPPRPPLLSPSKAHHTLRRTNLIRRRRQQLLTARTPSLYTPATIPFPALTFAQSLTAMVRELRKGNSQTGLILANGGVLTYQHVLCLSKQPRQDGSNYPLSNPLPRYITDFPIPSNTAHAEGEAIIEVRSPPLPFLYTRHTHQYTDILPLTIDIHSRIQPRRCSFQRLRCRPID